MSNEIKRWLYGGAVFGAESKSDAERGSSDSSSPPSRISPEQ